MQCKPQVFNEVTLNLNAGINWIKNTMEIKLIEVKEYEVITQADIKAVRDKRSGTDKVRTCKAGDLMQLAVRWSDPTPRECKGCFCL